MVNRALSFARSDPRGPVYLVGAREAMEEDITPYQVNQDYWHPVEPSALSQSAVEYIADALLSAQEPLMVTGYSGRDHKAVGELVKLADTVKGLRVLDTGGSDMCFPANHPAWLGLRYGVEPAITTADVILVLNCDVPWIPTQCKPKEGARIIHIDVDPLKQQMPVFYINAERRYRADSYTAINQIHTFINSSSSYKQKLESLQPRWEKLQQSHKEKLEKIKSLAQPSEDGYFNCSYLMSEVRKACPEDTIWAVEAVTNTAFVADQIQATHPGSWINCGGGGLGWSGGAVCSLLTSPPFIQRHNLILTDPLGYWN